LSEEDEKLFNLKKFRLTQIISLYILIFYKRSQITRNGYYIRHKSNLFTKKKMHNLAG